MAGMKMCCLERSGLGSSNAAVCQESCSVHGQANALGGCVGMGQREKDGNSTVCPPLMHLQHSAVSTSQWALHDTGQLAMGQPPAPTLLRCRLPKRSPMLAPSCPFRPHSPTHYHGHSSRSLLGRL